MAKRFKTSNNYFIVEDTLTGVEELREPKDDIKFKKYQDKIDFYSKSTGRKTSAGNYDINKTSILNGDNADTPFADLNEMVGFLEVQTGNFKNPQEGGANGFIFIADGQYTEASPLSIIAGEANAQQITNDKTVFLNDVGLENGDTIWNSTTNKLEPDNFGDEYDVRFQCVANPALNNRNFTIFVDIGDGVTPNIIWQKTTRLARGANVNTDVTELMDLFTYNTFIANGGTINVWSDGDVEIFDIKLKISRKFKFIP